MTTLLDTVRTASARGPEWLLARRHDAIRNLVERGLPTHKTENWRHTDVRSVASVPFETRALSKTDELETLAWAKSQVLDDGTFQIFVLNGGIHIPSSTTGGLEIKTLRTLVEHEPKKIESHLGCYAASEYFTALNLALFTDGVFIRVLPNATINTPIQLVFVSQANDTPIASYPRVLFVGSSGSASCFIETFLSRSNGGKLLTNAVTEIVLEPDAHVDHTRSHETAAKDRAFHIGNISVVQQSQSSFRSRVITLGGALTRCDIRVTLAGKEANCDLGGVYFASTHDHVEQQTLVEHTVGECISKQNYRGVVDGTGEAVFNGTVIVQREAQKTNAHQENRNLLLSPGGVVHTKPHLEIDADDVRCSHAATVGSLDEEALFYLLTRGLSYETARSLLMRAFVESVASTITPSVGRRIHQRMSEYLPGAETGEPLEPTDR